MQTPDLLDFESLTQPLSQDAPTGINLREDISPDSVYYQVKDARNAARSAERTALQSEDPSSAAPADWGPVLQLSPQIIGGHAKDLEIVAWWIEALARTAGFAGLRDGFRLATELITRFWDDLYPMPDEDGLATRTAPITGLNGEEGEGTLIAPIGMIPLVADGEHEFGLWHYNLARELSRMTDESQRTAREQANGVSMAIFDAAVSGTGPDFFQTIIEDLDACLERYAEMCAVLDEKCGDEPPPASNIRNALTEVQAGLKYITKDVLLSMSEAAADTAETPAEAGAPAPAAAQAPAPPAAMRTRADAIGGMRKIAEFFRETEPHSPIPYLLDQAIRWGQTPLPELVKELIPDSGALGHFQLVTGLRKGQASDSED